LEPKEHTAGGFTVALPLGDPRRIVNNGKYVGCVPPASWTVTVTTNPEDTIHCYEQEGVTFKSTEKFVKYLREQHPKAYIMMLASCNRSQA